MKPANFKKIAVPLYIIFVVFAYFYVDSVLKSSSARQVIDESDNKREPETVTANLAITSPSFNINYVIEAKDDNSVYDLIVKAQERNPEFTYEVTRYTYGYTFDHVNNIKSSGSTEWQVYDGDENITRRIDKIKLEEGKEYFLIYKDTGQ